MVDLAAQLEALQHENETLHRQNLTLQSALVVRSSESVLQTAPRPASDPTVSTRGQARPFSTWGTCLPSVQPACGLFCTAVLLALGEVLSSEPLQIFNQVRVGESYQPMCEGGLRVLDCLLPGQAC